MEKKIISQAEDESPLCSICNNPLTESLCPECNGKGRKTYMLFLKIQCKTCNGAGRLFTCPNFKLHPKEIAVSPFKDLLKQPPSNISQKSNRVLCTICGGKGQIEHYERTDAGQKVFFNRPSKLVRRTCPNCKGKGWL